MKKARIGLFGGSFNPIHEGHLNIAKYAINRLNLDELIFIPCYQSVDKSVSQYASVFHRLFMLFKVLPKKCSVSLFEINQKKPIQTIETLKYFRNLFEDAVLFFIMGDDSFATINTWNEYEKFDKYVNLVVFRRSDNNIKWVSGLKAWWMKNELWDYSSSKIRNGELLGVDLKVEKYMKENNLYVYEC